MRKEYNDIVSLNNGLLLQIISDVLDLSRIESGHADLVRTRFDLRTLCREAVETFRLQTPEEVVLDVEKGLPSCTVCQYRQGLMQILANFIRNALKFTPKGFVTVGFERKRDRLSLYVRDTGIGIPAEELDKIFERFYKVDTFTQGTGLGLSICKSIAEQMGAQIGVDSAVGEGSGSKCRSRNKPTPFLRRRPNRRNFADFQIFFISLRVVGKRMTFPAVPALLRVQDPNENKTHTP